MGFTRDLFGTCSGLVREMMRTGMEGEYGAKIMLNGFDV